MTVRLSAEPGTGRHRRRDEDTAGAVQQYDYLMHLLHAHQPGERSGLCVICGIAWPCFEVLAAYPGERR